MNQTKIPEGSCPKWTFCQARLKTLLSSNRTGNEPHISMLFGVFSIGQ